MYVLFLNERYHPPLTEVLRCTAVFPDDGTFLALIAKWLLINTQ
jgi:hypothetical protein